MFALIDCNNFYAACERLFEPRLEGVPLGVLSNNDGCVIARSEEFKALDIPMGIPTHKIAPHLRRRIVLKSSNYTLYGDLSARVQQVLAQQVPTLEPYSIDECFLDLRGMREDWHALGAALVRSVQRQVGLPVSIGIAPTRTLAKLANRQAKTQPTRPQVCVWQSADAPELAAHLARLSPREVWGVGERLNARLAGMGIVTAAALRETPDSVLRRRFSVVLARTAAELNGQACLSMGDLETPRRSILCSRSFGQPLRDRASLAGALRHHCQRAGEKLRRDAMQASAIGVYMRTNPHHAGSFHQACEWAALPFPSADTQQLNRAAQRLLARLWQPAAYQKLGVMLTELTPRRQSQTTLFDGAEPARQEALMHAWDTIRARYGRQALTLGPQPADAPWQMNSAYRSACYTTRWDELPRARAR
ncbi:Y-family DNA polymerase [Chromohalobacter israelensis]|uniref:Y-family DNA polymerase n=1 Tax=Chromohalobacter israelensis TaxID=141390 RepID=UPI000553696D|nr:MULTISPECIES: Y-family DNA polymerase [Chromohalobacter]MDF9434961.1 Y-family DNA polymerase [Chromohalobacter israelensis]MDO0944806.1 Y-family DNA polymerase [Chromohalobacter salexigens]PWW41196.1 DNA polymerase V [Chromohalobacter salexigens]